MTDYLLDHPLMRLAHGTATSVAAGNETRALTRQLEAVGFGAESDEIEDALAGVKSVVEAGLSRAARLAMNDEGDPDGLDRSWRELDQAVAGNAGQALRRGRDALDRLEHLLLAKAKPAPVNDPSARLLARQEIELRIGSAPAVTRAEIAMQLAATGDPAVQAELASGWGKAYVESLGGIDHTTLTARVVKAEADRGSKAAVAFLASGQLGHRLRRAELAIYQTGQAMKPGRGTYRNPSDRANRHADLAELAAAGRTDAAA